MPLADLGRVAHEDVLPATEDTRGATMRMMVRRGRRRKPRPCGRRTGPSAVGSREALAAHVKRSSIDVEAGNLLVAAAVLAVGVVLMHGLAGSWMPALFPELQKPITEPIQLGLGVKLFLMGYLVLSVAGGAGVVLLFSEGTFIRDRQRWAHEEEVRRRQWALQEQLREMERQIREEQLPDQERAWHRQYQERQLRIRREARRRLGLPEEG